MEQIKFFVDTLYQDVLLSRKQNNMIHFRNTGYVSYEVRAHSFRKPETGKIASVKWERTLWIRDGCFEKEMKKKSGKM